MEQVRLPPKERRKQKIVNAAEQLIRQTGGTDFSMVRLAELAGVSPTTPYNLFGTKGGILYALLNQSADIVYSEARQPSGATALERLRDAAHGLAAVLVRDPSFYKPLYTFLLAIPDPVSRPAFTRRSQEYWRDALTGDGPCDIAHAELDRLANRLRFHALGCVEVWVHGELADESFGPEMACGVCDLYRGWKARREDVLDV